ncbi:MAG: hypothetical protein R3F59_19455 [Myxococcota bacterium]
MENENQGSMLLGILMGLVLGCVGVIIAFVLQGQKTITGAIVGMVLQWALGLCAGGVLFALQLVLANSY